MAETGKNLDDEAGQEATNDDELFTAREAAGFLGISERRLHQLRRRGELASVRSHRFPPRYIFRSSELMAYVERVAKRMVPPTSPAKPDKIKPPVTTGGTTKESVPKAIGPLWPPWSDQVDETNRIIDSPILRTINFILVNSFEVRASEVHFEPSQHHLRVRCRIDGQLHELMTFPLHIKAHLLRHLKIIGGIPLFTRLALGPQTGVVLIKQGEQFFNVHISCAQTLHGESVVLRFYAVTPQHLNECGLYSEMYSAWEKLLYAPNSLLLLTGPHGSGKTTTAYATLNQINEIKSKIVSLEDYRGYELPGVQQMYLSDLSGVPYSDAVEAALCLRPDVLFLGAIDTAERARCALNAAQSGPLVLATLPANDAQTALTRLAGWGVPTQSIRGVLAQTLLRRICPDCFEDYPATDEDLTILHRLVPTPLEGEILLRRGKGCEKCRNTGYYGRLPVYELLYPNSDNRYSPAAFDRNADAAKKIRDGLFTTDEVRRLLLSPTAGR